MSINYSLVNKSKSLFINDSFGKMCNKNSQSAYVEQQDGNHHHDDNESLFSSLHNYLFHIDWLEKLLIEEHHILEYSSEYGFLRLTPEIRQKFNIEVFLVTLGK